MAAESVRARAAAGGAEASRGHRRACRAPASCQSVQPASFGRCSRRIHPMKKLYRCTRCLLTVRTPFMKHAVAFGANSAAEVAQRIDRLGAWTRCLACQEDVAASAIATSTDPGGLICGNCMLRRPLHYYEASAVRNRNRNKTILCRACKGAKICASCAKWKPKTEFRPGAEYCKVCQSITCAGCGKEKVQAQYILADVYRFFTHHQNVLCQACREAGTKLKEAAHKTYKGAFSGGKRCQQHCRECGVTQDLVAFRRSEGRRTDICRKCEVLPCAACAAILPQHSFAPGEVTNCFSHAHKVVCLECKKLGCSVRRPELYPCAGPCNKLLGSTAYAPADLSSRRKDGTHSMVCDGCKKHATSREQRLRKLLKKSKRAACTCKRPLAHSEKCAMHMRFAGERPYPGCDVMSREDSDWLQKRNSDWLQKRKSTHKT